jgi:hypothetical protein
MVHQWPPQLVLAAAPLKELWARADDIKWRLTKKVRDVFMAAE